MQCEALHAQVSSMKSIKQNLRRSHPSSSSSSMGGRSGEYGGEYEGSAYDEYTEFPPSGPAARPVSGGPGGGARWGGDSRCGPGGMGRLVRQSGQLKSLVQTQQHPSSSGGAGGGAGHTRTVKELRRKKNRSVSKTASKKQGKNRPASATRSRLNSSEETSEGTSGEGLGRPVGPHPSIAPSLNGLYHAPPPHRLPHSQSAASLSSFSSLSGGGRTGGPRCMG